MPADSFGLIAGGNINPSVFVELDATADATVIQGDASTILAFGVSGEWTEDAPGLSGASTFHASTGSESVKVYGPGESCLLTAGAAVTRGALLMSNASGQGITATTGNYANAVAVESAAGSGELIRVRVTDPVYVP